MLQNLKNALASAVALIGATFKAGVSTVGAVGRFLGGRGGGGAKVAPDLDGNDAKRDHLAETIAANAMSSYERRLRGLEPEDVRAFIAADTPDARREMGLRLTLKTRAWASSLSEGERRAVMQAPKATLAAHLSGERNLAGVRSVSIINEAARDPMVNPHGNGLARKIANDNGERRKAFGRFRAIEARRAAAAEASHAGANPSFQLKQLRMTARNEANAAKRGDVIRLRPRGSETETPRPPAAMLREGRKNGHLRPV